MPSEFWDLCLDEIIDLLSAYNEKYKSDLKSKLILNNILARQIGEHVASLFDKNAKISALWDLYPELFKDEKEKYDKQMQENQWKIWKAQFENFLQQSKKEGGI